MEKKTGLMINPSGKPRNRTFGNLVLLVRACFTPDDQTEQGVFVNPAPEGVMSYVSA